MNLAGLVCGVYSIMDLFSLGLLSAKCRLVCDDLMGESSDRAELGLIRFSLVGVVSALRDFFTSVILQLRTGDEMCSIDESRDFGFSSDGFEREDFGLGICLDVVA